MKNCLACLTQYVLQLVSETDGIAIIVELMMRSGGSRGKIGNGRKGNGKTETENRETTSNCNTIQYKLVT